MKSSRGDCKRARGSANGTEQNGTEEASIAVASQTSAQRFGKASAFSCVASPREQPRALDQRQKKSPLGERETFRGGSLLFAPLRSSSLRFARSLARSRKIDQQRGPGGGIPFSPSLSLSFALSLREGQTHLPRGCQTAGQAQSASRRTTSGSSWFRSCATTRSRGDTLKMLRRVGRYASKWWTAMMMMIMRLRAMIGASVREERTCCLSSALRCRRLLRVAAATGTTAAADRSHPPPRPIGRGIPQAPRISSPSALSAASANLPLLRRRHHGDHPS